MFLLLTLRAVQLSLLLFKANLLLLLLISNIQLSVLINFGSGIVGHDEALFLKLLEK